MMPMAHCYLCSMNALFSFKTLTHRSIYFLCVLSMCMVMSCETGSTGQETNKEEVNDSVHEKDQESEKLKVQSTVEEFLKVAGNYEIEAMAQMIADKANLGIGRKNNGEWETSLITIDEYFESVKNRDLLPYFEPVSDYVILLNQGQIVQVRADATLHRFGMPMSTNKNQFTLIKQADGWKFINLSFTASPLSDEEQKFDLDVFAKSYAQAWSGSRPEFVAMYFAENGSLRINDGDAAVGRAALAEVALSFMTDLPDMLVRYDSLVYAPSGPQFHWTLIATNSGPGGTGNRVHVSGYEEWTMNENNRILTSQGHFPSEEYDRQLQHGL